MAGPGDPPHQPTPPRTVDGVLVGSATAPGVAAGPVVRLGDPAAPAGGIVVAADVTPGDVLALDLATVQALATAAGAPLSHAAILARSRGIPAVTGLGPGVLAVEPGTVVLLDGDAGTIHVAPAGDVTEAVRARREAADRRRREARRRAGEPALTRDGHRVDVVANVGSAEDARAAVAEGADGVGMLRTEFAFLNRAEPPGEDEQYEAYRGVADALGDRPLILRTLDLGSDIPAWGGVPEPNPALGHRGLRFTLASPELFGTQLRAAVRLARERPLRVMFPMVTTVDELRRARACLDAVVAQTAAGGGTAPAVEVGITVEVPAAALTAEAFAPLVDFFAVGSNDLTQYTLAADRANAAVAGITDGLHPGVLRLVRMVTEAGGRHGRPVEVVGELATDPVAVPVLLGLGVSMLSVRPNAVAAVKQAVRDVDLRQAQALAAAALAAESAFEVRRLAAAT